MKKPKYQLEKELFYEDGWVMEDVKFEIDKDAFKGPFICHNKKTVLAGKKASYKGLEATYSVWKCRKCKKEYLDSDQGRIYEKFLIMRQLLDDPITMKGAIDFDGKAYVFRFPKELNKSLHKGDLVKIKPLSQSGDLFLVEVMGGGLQNEVSKVCHFS